MVGRDEVLMEQPVKLVLVVSPGGSPPDPVDVAERLYTEYISIVAEERGPHSGPTSWEIVDCVPILQTSIIAPDLARQPEFSPDSAS